MATLAGKAQRDPGGRKLGSGLHYGAQGSFGGGPIVGIDVLDGEGPGLGGSAGHAGAVYDVEHHAGSGVREHDIWKPRHHSRPPIGEIDLGGGVAAGDGLENAGKQFVGAGEEETEIVDVQPHEVIAGFGRYRRFHDHVVHALTATLNSHGEAGRGAILHDDLAAKDHDVSGGGAD